jgi:hypothetical protein
MYKLMLVIITPIIYLFIQRIEISESIIWDVSAKGLIRPRQQKLVLLVKGRTYNEGFGEQGAE